MFGFVINMIACMLNVAFGVMLLQDGGNPTVSFICAGFSAFFALFFLVIDL